MSFKQHAFLIVHNKHVNSIPKGPPVIKRNKIFTIICDQHRYRCNSINKIFLPN